MFDGKYVAYIVDDDPLILRSLTKLLATTGYDVRPYSTGDAFLAKHDPSVPGCAVFDISMPGMNGLQLQDALASAHSRRPVIFLSGAANISMSVDAMKAGAVDFLTKPVSPSKLLVAVADACNRSSTICRHNDQLEDVAARLVTLTPRERQVLSGVVAGRLNKQIAGDLGISVKTIKMHRGSMMRKMKVRSVADLVRLVSLASEDTSIGTAH